MILALIILYIFVQKIRVMKNLFLILSIALFSSCASLNNILSDRPANSVVVTDYSEQMRLLRDNFPEIYDLYRDGRIILNDIYTYFDKNGVSRVGINYRHR